MGSYLKLENHDAMYRDSANKHTVIVNDHSLINDHDRDSVRKLIFTEYEGDILENVPTCLCEQLTKARNRGRICPNCNTTVEYRVERDLDPILFARQPVGVASFVNPHFWLMMSIHFYKSGFDQLRWLVDTHYNPIVRGEGPQTRLLRAIEKRGIKRGWNSFIHNFDAAFEILVDTLKPGDPRRAEFMTMVTDPSIRSCIFSEYVPFPNRAMLILEKNNLGKYCEKSLHLAVDAAMTLYGIDTEYCNKPQHNRERLVWKTIHLLSQYLLIQYKEILGKKPGIYRKNVNSTKCRLSGRNVIISLTKPHHYRQIEMSWGMASTILGVHISNLMLQEHKTPKEMDILLNEYALRYHPELDRYFTTLIENSSDSLGIPLLMQRNPTLEKASCQKVAIGSVKLSADPTNSIPILDVVGPNADFDGDQFAYMLLLDNYMSDAFEEFAPERSVFSVGEPRKLSGNAAITKQVILSTALNLRDADNEMANPDILANMMQFVA